jgi:hypothetical protein
LVETPTHPLSTPFEFGHPQRYQLGGIKYAHHRKVVVAAIVVIAAAGLAYAEDLSPKSRVELKRADLSAPGANMEVVLSVTEYQPGDFIARRSEGDKGGSSGRRCRCHHHSVCVLDAVIHRHLDDRITRLDGQSRRLRSFRCRVGILRLPVDLQQISAALRPLAL